MKLFSLLLFAASSVAVAVPAPQPDAVALTDSPTSDLVGVELPEFIAATQDKHLWPFEWKTTERCENGKVRVSGTFTVPGFTNDFTLENGQLVYVKVFGENLVMQYIVKEFYTRFMYGNDCKWGLLSAWCGQCYNIAWNGGELDCQNGDKNAQRTRTDKCYVKVEDSKSAVEQSKDIAARQTEETEHATTLETPPAGTPLLFDITTDATSPVHGDGLPDPQPDFWHYQLDIKEFWNGDLLQATGDFHAVGVNHRFLFSGTDTFIWAKINDKYLHIEYDFHNHRTNFRYDGYTWGMDIYAASGLGMCWREKDKGWSKPPLPYRAPAGDARTILLTCYLYTGRLPPKGDAGEQVKTVVGRGLVQTPTITAAPATHTQSITPPDTAGTQDLVGYFDFSLSITEYCEASEGTPLKARGWWSVKGSNDGMKVWFGGDQVTHMSLGYPPFSLQVGPYDFYTRRVNFHYGGCHWDQDTNGIGDCGYCTSSPWSAQGLNCAVNAAAGRTHQIDCSVAVERKKGDSPDQPKLLNARDSNSTVTIGPTVEVQATATRTIVPEVIATQISAQGWTTILPFHITLTEYCNNGATATKGHYKAAGILADMDLRPGQILAVIHQVPNYPPLLVGPFDYGQSRVRFEYDGGAVEKQCVWYDEDRHKQCGECRAALWSSGPLDCAAGGTSRIREMDCSFILGSSKT